MGIDVEIWSVEPLDSSIGLPRSDKWVRDGDVLRYSTRSWQLSVDLSVRVENDEIPDELGPHLVGISYRTGIFLEPIHAPASAHAFLRQLVRTILRTSQGVMVAEGQIIDASGRRRAAHSRSGETISVLQLSWWFEKGALSTREGATDLLRYFRKFLPDFLPRRYGGSEPARNIFKPEGVDEFIHFLFTEEWPVWVPNGKLLHVHYRPSVRPRLTDAHGMSVPTLQVSCAASLLDVPGWETAMRRLWSFVCGIAEPFYGDVRILGGHIARGRSWCYLAQTTEVHPVRGLWRGLPNTLGLCAVLGPPYTSLWTAFTPNVSVGGQVACASVCSWREGGELTDEIGPVPPELIQPGQARWVETVSSLHEELPVGLSQVWPFK